MANRFPRVELLNQIYAQDKFKRYVLEVHSGVIVFAKEAAHYFLRASSEFTCCFYRLLT